MFKYQKGKQANWVQHPTKNQMLLVVIIMLVGSFLIVLATSNLFTESPFQRKNTVLLFLLLPALISCIRVCRNYASNRKANKI
jgi:nicotinamide riboside transporter PnuC